MSELVSDLRDWLDTLPVNSTVGVDQGGLALVCEETGDYYEVGGVEEGKDR